LSTDVSKKKINPLLFSPSPRNIPKVYDSLKETGYDRLYSKYFTEEIAYNLGRDFFLKHEEYTHFVICPDDLLVGKKHIDALIKNLEKYDYQIHAGVCNVDNGKYKNYLCITENLPHPIRIMKASTDGTEPKQSLIGWRHYAWYSTDYDFGEEPIQSVYFSGFAAQFISRKIMETVKFEDDSSVNHIPNVTGGSLDVVFSNKMFQINIPQMVDTRIRMNHLAGGGLIIPGLETDKGLQKQDYGSSVEGKIGDGEVRFYRANEDTYDLIYEEPKGIKRKWMMKNGNVIGQMKDTPSDVL